MLYNRSEVLRIVQNLGLGVLLIAAMTACDEGVSADEASQPFAQPTKFEQVYVEEGDGFSKIADRCERDGSELEALNSGKPLHTGDTITVPEPNNCRSADEVKRQLIEDCNIFEETARLDDNPNSFAYRNGVDVTLSNIVNGITSMTNIAGQVLKVPRSCRISW